MNETEVWTQLHDLAVLVKKTCTNSRKLAGQVEESIGMVGQASDNTKALAGNLTTFGQLLGDLSIRLGVLEKKVADMDAENKIFRGQQV